MQIFLNKFPCVPMKYYLTTFIMVNIFGDIDFCHCDGIGPNSQIFGNHLIGAVYLPLHYRPIQFCKKSIF